MPTLFTRANPSERSGLHWKEAPCHPSPVVTLGFSRTPITNVGMVLFVEILGRGSVNVENNPYPYPSPSPSPSPTRCLSGHDFVRLYLSSIMFGAKTQTQAQTHYPTPLRICVFVFLTGARQRVEGVTYPYPKHRRPSRGSGSWCYRHCKQRWFPTCRRRGRWERQC